MSLGTPSERSAFAAGASIAMAAFSLCACCTVTFRDAGELTTAAFLLDVPHPTGFPLDLIFVRIAMLVPFGDVAFRAGLGVAALMSLAAGLASVLATRALTPSPSPSPSQLDRLVRAVIAAFPALALVGSSTVLRAATAMEVYAGATALCLAALANATSPSNTPLSEGTKLRTAALLVGLSTAMHTTARPAALIGLVLCFAPFVRSHRTRPSTIVTAGVFIVLGALVVAYLPLASRRNGPIDWGDPETLRSLLNYLSAKSIRGAYANRILVAWRFAGDLAHVARQAVEDLRAFIALGLAGVLLSARSTLGRALALTTLIDLLYSVTINPMGVIDRQTLFATEACLAIAAALAIAWIAPKTPRAAIITAALFAVVNLATIDTAWSARADNFAVSDLLGGSGALGELPPRAIVLCESDDLCGVAMYAQWVEGERPDVTVLPRQHVGLATTWRRLDPPRALVRVPRNGDARQRLAWLLSRLRSRIRWEGSDDADNVLTAPVGSGESPVLGIVGAPAGGSDTTAIEWVTARTKNATGQGARSIAGTTLVAAGRRLATRDISLAIAPWRAAITLNPEQVSAYTNLGVAAARRGQLNLAIALTERALDLDPERARAWHNLAGYLAATGDLARAEAANREADRRR